MVSLSRVDVFDSSAFPRSSYASEYTVPSFQPTTRFRNYVRVVVNTPHKLVPRCFPHFALHVSPHRILDYEHSALGFGPTGAEYVETEQGEPKVADAEHTKAGENEIDCEDTARSGSGQEQGGQEHSENQEREDSENLPSEEPKSSENMVPRKNNEIPKHVLDEVTANIYKSTAMKAAEECPLPVQVRPVVLPIIIGNNTDRELYHSVYRRTGTWKTNVVPVNWERAQERPLYEDPKAKQYRPCRLRYSKSKSRLLSKRSQKRNDKTVEDVVEKDVDSGSLPPAIQHIRPQPGYAGFVPKLPVIPSPARDLRLMLSTSSAAYRNLAREELHVMEHAHKGPLSKLVTTTMPCNPFNKRTRMSQPTSLFII